MVDVCIVITDSYIHFSTFDFFIVQFLSIIVNVSIQEYLENDFEFALYILRRNSVSSAIFQF
jgi:hypothetical protein